MTRQDAIKLLLDFMYRELNTPMNDNPWKLLRGDRICTECRKHKRSTLYMLVEENSPLIFHCFRATCGKAEAVSRDHLHELGFTNDEAISVLLSKNLTKNTRVINLYNHHLVIRDLELTQDQVTYLQTRLGYIPTAEELSRFRIIPNIKQVIEENHLIEVNPAIDELYRRLSPQKTMISFTNSDYDLFSCRSITSSFKGLLSLAKSKRFMGYDLSNTKENEPIENLVIAEGIFDILNIQKYFAVIPNTLYLASCGFNNIIPILKYYYRKNIESIKRIIIFIDSDEYDGRKYTYKKYMYLSLKRGIQELGGDFEFYIIHNTASKDFGDMSKPIKPHKEEIKFNERT